MPDVPSREEFEALQKEVELLRQEVARLSRRPNYKELLTTSEACEFLGVSRDTLNQYFKKGKIDRIRQGRTIHYKLSSLEAYLDKRSYKPEAIIDRLARIKTN